MHGFFGDAEAAGKNGMDYHHWVGIGSVMMLLSLFWLAYTIKAILNDEAAMERRRRRHREREERRRAREDKEFAQRGKRALKK